MPHQGSANRPERQSLDVLVLREILSNTIRLGAGADLRVPNRQRTDPVCRDQVAFQQEGRYPQRVRDVVESIGRIVRREQRRDVDIEREQIADGVGVFGTIESMEKSRPARMGVRGGSTIELRLQPRDQTVVRRLVRSTRTLRRHRSGSKLTEDLLPHLGTLGHFFQIHGVQGQTRGF